MQRENSNNSNKSEVRSPLPKKQSQRRSDEDAPAAAHEARHRTPSPLNRRPSKGASTTTSASTTKHNDPTLRDGGNSQQGGVNTPTHGPAVPRRSNKPTAASSHGGPASHSTTRSTEWGSELCKYFHSREGCRRGSECKFIHE